MDLESNYYFKNFPCDRLVMREIFVFDGVFEISQVKYETKCEIQTFDALSHSCKELLNAKI